MVSSCCYARGYQVLAYRDFNEVIDDPIQNCCFVLISSGLKVLPTKPLQHCSDTAGSTVVIAAKPGGTPLYRLQFGNVGFCYKIPYPRIILELCKNSGLVAFGLNSFWAH